VVHNHWIHYKDLLFRSMTVTGLDFIVLFTAASSAHRQEATGPAAGEYPSCVLNQGPYESISQFSMARRVWRALNRVRPSCVIISGWYDAAAWAAWAWALLHRVPMILWAESNHFDRRRRTPIEFLKRAYIRCFRAAHVYGRSNKDYLLRLGFPENRIFTKRAVLDTELFRPAAPRNRRGPKVLLFVGRFAPEKNLERLLLAFRGVDQDDAFPRLVLRLIGYGPLESDLRALVSALRLDSVVEFRGPAAQPELPGLYAGADAIILASTSETWGLVVNEAMCCGLPALVSTRCGCAADLVDSRTGWTFDPDNVAHMMSVLECFAATPRDRLEEMGAAGRALAGEYSPDNCAAIVAQSLHMVLHQAGA
jgi:glycosyltransferase involved in cell wall biosynthesis